MNTDSKMCIVIIVLLKFSILGVGNDRFRLMHTSAITTCFF